MNNNALYAVIAVLAVVVAVLGYQYYQASQEPSGIELSVGKGGISVETK